MLLLGLKQIQWLIEPETLESQRNPKKSSSVKTDTFEKEVTRKKNVNHSPYVDRKVEKEKRIISRKDTENRDNNDTEDVAR